MFHCVILEPGSCYVSLCVLEKCEKIVQDLMEMHRRWEGFRLNEHLTSHDAVP